MQLRRTPAWAVLATTAAITLTGCVSAPATGPIGEHAPQAPVLDPAIADGAAGDVTICGNRDNGTYSKLTESFNAKDTGVTAHYLEIGQDTDSTRTQAIQRLEGGSRGCDIYLMDVTWVSEWAAQGWIQDHSRLVEAHRSDLIPSTLETARYDGRFWAVPLYTNAGLLFYRQDRVPPPTTWSQVYASAAADPQHQVEMQGKRYEGLTVNFLEMLYSAGGSVIDERGNVTVDSPQTRAVLRLLTEGLESGAVDRASLTYDEDGGRRAYESGRAGYLRQWPSALKQIEQTGAGPGTAVAALPAFDEHSRPAAVLGGWNLAVAAKADNPAGSVAVIDYATSAEFQKIMVLEHSQAPVHAATYDDPQVIAELPFIPQLKQSVLSAKPRPKSPVYAQLSRAVYRNVYQVISGQTDVESGVRKMAEDVRTAQETF
ncbi:multiple sugar transport system substrate-binding protein [Saccharopolyspora antimicrobica]|uniref:Carbohydrate ABC transporter substrate-binding protein (CUT1 family) n=1 Tax=Saccharopolyspora antimicrobica TaxID=455193 RepID=A0A1I5GK80_9PSEU|nr:ABC transporter substrate-binding protein [Saccharopolyspora antimicrobica]RKT87500.1 carbohydrate ABC transporter substrate-binding protein (CUT1 family) [Saccharopolyspora antimicrobica]SFO36395.1 multiple sugar transport system substrate-binding protein [Saccharopolyspora antimicrobica]